VTFFSTLDLARGYHKLPLASLSRRLLAFSNHKGKYEWRGFSFRVVMGPMVFQERIAQIMEGLNWNYVLAYIDDIIVITKGDYENHLEVLQQGSEVLEYQVSTVGTPPQYEFLDRIRAWPKPKSRDEWRVYLGWFPFLSMFSPSTSSILRPLQNLLGKKRSMSDWSSEHDECFEA